MKKLKKVFFSAFFALMSGCSMKTVPVYAVVKTPGFKIADQGFLKEGFGYKELIIYKDANVPVKITVKNSEICMYKNCIDKEAFIKKYISEDYGSEFLDKLLDFQCPNVGVCKKNKNSILFKDRKKNILILIKKIK